MRLNVFYDFGGSRDLDYVAAGAILDLEPYLEADPQWRDRFLDYWSRAHIQVTDTMVFMQCRGAVIRWFSTITKRFWRRIN